MGFWQAGREGWGRLLLMGACLMLSGCSRSEPAPTLPALTALPPATATGVALELEGAADTPTAAPSEVGESGGPEVQPDISYNGTSFDYPIALATAVEPSTVFLDSDQAPLLPPFDRFLFVDYPAGGGSQSARLEIYQAKPFADLNLGARGEIGRLRALLEERPPLDVQPPLPFLPLLPEPPQVMGQAAYLDFPAGRGIRYVTQLEPTLSGGPLVYTFQGLSADGTRYISAIFPLLSPEPPVTQFEELSQEAFEPALLLLDSLIRSLKLTPREPQLSSDQLALESPAPGALQMAGEKLAVSGVAPAGVTAVEVRLAIGPLILVSGSGRPDAEQRWQVTLPIPLGVSGRLMLVVETAEGRQVQPLEILLPEEAGMAPAFELFQPLAADVAVAGYPLFFAGSLLEPVDGRLQLAVLVNDCQDQIAEQLVVLGAYGGEWNGYLQLPERVTGPACALAYTGDAENGGLRLHVRPVEIVASSAAAAPRLTLGFTERSYFKIGEEGLFFGGAVGAGAAGVSVQLLAEDGRIVAQQAVAVENGLWQAAFQLPAELGLNPRVRITLLDDPEVWVEQGISVVAE